MERDYLSSLLNLFRKRINKIFVGLLVIIISACDFDNPDDFELPNWFIDIKLPLVSKRFPMGDLVDTANYIYPTDDSLGFQILFGSDIEPPFEPDQIPLDVLFADGRISQSVSEEFGGVPEADISIDQSIPPAELTSLFPISVLQYNNPVYLDTTLIINPLTGDTLSQEFDGVIWYGTPFEFPLDGEKTMSAEFYNTFLVDPVNGILDSLLGIINALFPLELPFDTVLQQIPAEASFISDIDSLIIASGAASVYSSYFKNKGYPTGLVGIYSRLLSGSNSFALNDTLANHVQDTLSYTDNPFERSTPLSGEGLSKYLSMALGCRLARATEPVTFLPGENDSLYIDFKVQLGIPGISSIVVSMDSTNLPLGDQIDQFKSQLNFSSNMPEMEGTTLDIISGKMDLSSAIPSSDITYGNKLVINNLESSFPWDLKFYLYIPNFEPPSSGGDLVKIDEVLTTNNEINKTFELYGYTLEPEEPDTTLSSLVCSLAVIIPAQQATIPLGSESLGGFGMNLSFGSMFFESFDAYIYQELTADTLDIDGYPPEMTGIGFPGLEFEFEFEYSVSLPLGININMVGVSPSGEEIKSPLTIDLLPPETWPNVSTVKSIIRWNKLGSTTEIYAPHDSAEPDTTIITIPDQTSNEVSIVDFFAAMPLEAVAQVNAKIKGNATIRDKPGSIDGAFKLKLPFLVTMNAPAFIPPTGVSELDTMDHGTRNKIRHSLIYSELATTVENSFPLGGEFAILLSNEPYFPKDITSEALSAFVDTMANRDSLRWNPDDELYIIDECDLLSPSSGNIYIFNIMSDSTQCVDGVKYLVKFEDGDMDTVVSFVDTLFRVILPDPDSLYQETNSEGHLGQVAVPGIISHSSVLDTGRIFLLTDYGVRYIVPRFSFDTTGVEERFFSRYDAIDIKSFITFRVASTGVLGDTENDIVLKSPNGGERISSIDDSPYPIEWETYGEVSSVDIYYVEGPDPSINLWQEIVTDLQNESTYPWDIVNTLESDFVRIIIKDSNSELYDISGWYFKVAPIITPRIATDNGILNNTRIKRPGKSR